MAVTTKKVPQPPRGTLRTPELYALAVGQVIGAGVITLVVPAMGMTGNSVWLAYLAAILVGFLYISPFFFATSALRVSGGTYSLVSDFMGPKAGSIFAISYLSGPLYLCMFLIPCTMYVGDIIPAIGTPMGQILFPLSLSVVFLVLNWNGIDIMAKVQKLMVWLLIAALSIYIVFGISRLHLPIFDFSHANFMPNGFVQFQNGNLSGGFLTAVFLFYASTTGYYMVMGYGSAAYDSKRDVPRAMLLTVPTIIVLYVGVAIATAGSTSLEEFGGSATLVTSARNLLPAPLFYFFIICGPIMALLSSLNSSYGFHTSVIGQASLDGWFPRKLAAKNKHGQYGYILILLFLISSVPIILQYNIVQLINLLQFVSLLTTLLPSTALFMLPKKYPEAWEKARLHIPNPLYYTFCGASVLISIVVFLKSCLSLDVKTFAVCTVMLIAILAVALWRAKTANIEIQTSVWGEEPPEA